MKKMNLSCLDIDEDVQVRRHLNWSSWYDA